MKASNKNIQWTDGKRKERKYIAKNGKLVLGYISILQDTPIRYAVFVLGKDGGFQKLKESFTITADAENAFYSAYNEIHA